MRKRYHILGGPPPIKKHELERFGVHGWLISQYKIWRAHEKRSRREKHLQTTMTQIDESEQVRVSPYPPDESLFGLRQVLDRAQGRRRNPRGRRRNPVESSSMLHSFEKTLIYVYGFRKGCETGSCPSTRMSLARSPPRNYGEP